MQTPREPTDPSVSADPGEPPPPGASGEAPAQIPQEVEKFLVAFARALQKYAMYPEGHPALEPAAESVASALARATEDRERLDLSVAPGTIGFREASTDPEGSLFRSLARRLHRHHLASVSLHAGAGDDELATLLKALAREAEGEGAAGLRYQGALPGCPRVRVQPVPYASMKLAGDSPELAERARNLWFELARVALEMGEDADESQVSLDPEEVARAVTEGSGDDGRYAEDVLQRLSEAASLFRGTRRREGAGALGTLSDQVSTLIRELPPEVFVRLLEDGGSPEQARQTLFDVSFQLDPDALEKVLDAVADVRFVEISGWLHRIFGKLGAHARSDEDGSRDEADRHMREQIREMVASWELENPNPTEYEGALSRLAADREGEGTARLAPVEPLRMIRMGLELDVGGDWIREAAAEVGGEDPVALVADLVETPDEVGAADGVWEGILGPRWMRDFFAPPEPEPELAAAYLERCGAERAEELVDVLSGAESRAVRRRVFDRLAELGDAVGPVLADRLDQEEWFVRRNFLSLLNQMDELPSGFSALPYLEDDHPEIRYEAISLALRNPESRARAIRQALEDPHSRTVILGLTAAREGCPPELVARIVEVAGDLELAWAVRVHAIRALGSMDDEEGRDALVELVTRRRWPFFWRRRLRASSRTVLEALRSLRRGWEGDGRARRVLELARASSDPEIRRAVEEASEGEDGS